VSKKYYCKCSICGTEAVVMFDEQGNFCGQSCCYHFEGYEERDGKIIFNFLFKYKREVEAKIGEY